LEYLSFKQYKLIVKMTRIGSGVTIPKGLFTQIYTLLECQESDGQNFLAAIVPKVQLVAKKKGTVRIKLTHFYNFAIVVSLIV
jgi:hypothetical protein